MKILAAIILFTLSIEVSRAQTMEELVNQKETQKKYLIQQIAAFKIYLGYVEKSYSIASKGLTTILKIKNGDFNLHKDFFNSCKSVNPTIRTYSKVADIIAFQVKIIQVYKSIYKRVKSINLYNENEIEYIYKVFTKLSDSCADDIDELITVITSNELEMKDDERLKRIDAIYKKVQDKYSFAKSFGDETKVLGIQRDQEKHNVEVSRILNGIKNK